MGKREVEKIDYKETVNCWIRLVNRLRLRQQRLVTINHDGQEAYWGITVPHARFDCLTRDTAPELELRLKRAFEILENGE